MSRRNSMHTHKFDGCDCSMSVCVATQWWIQDHISIRYLLRASDGSARFLQNDYTGTEQCLESLNSFSTQTVGTWQTY